MDGVEVVYMDDRVTPRSLDEYFRVVESLMQTATWGRPVLYEVQSPGAFDAAARRRLSNLLNQYRSTVAKNTLAYSLVTPSATVRGILTAVFWVSPPPYPHKICGTVKEAFEWFATKVPALDPKTAYLNYVETKTRLLGRLDGTASMAS